MEASVCPTPRVGLASGKLSEAMDLPFQFLMRLQPSVDVAHETFVFGAFDGGAFEESSVLLLGEVSPVVGCHLQ